mgnify:CR=1 FL=1
MNIKDAAETFALNQWLSDYPSEWSYDQIMEAIESDHYHDDISLWRLIENEPPLIIVELIDCTKWAFEQTVTALIAKQYQTMLSCAHE